MPHLLANPMQSTEKIYIKIDTSHHICCSHTSPSHFLCCSASLQAILSAATRLNLSDTITSYLKPSSSSHSSLNERWILTMSLQAQQILLPASLAASSSSSNSSALFPIHLSWGFCGKALLFLGWLTPVLNVSHCFLIRIASTFHPCLYEVHTGIPDHPDLLNVIINPSTLFLMDHHLFFFCYLWTWKTCFSSLSPLSHSLSHSFIQ